MNRATTLDTARNYVLKDRAADHGDLENNFTLIAILWSDYLETQVTSSDVAVLMVLLKVARTKSNPGHEDNWVDIAGYAACGAELATGSQ